MWIVGFNMLVLDPRPKASFKFIKPFTRRTEVAWYTPIRGKALE
jgi:hypothetical protein